MIEPYSPWSTADISRLHRVTQTNQAAIVGDPVRSAFLRPFLGRAVSVSQAAKELGCSTNSMLYRVRRMEAAGVVKAVATRKRAGRPIRLYKSAHDGWFVPTDVMPYDDTRHRVEFQGRKLITHIAGAYTAVLNSSSASGRILARDSRGDIWSSDLAPENNRLGQPVHFSDATVTLTRSEARRLHRHIIDALTTALDASRVSVREAPKESYVLSFVLLPLAE